MTPAVLTSAEQYLAANYTFVHLLALSLDERHRIADTVATHVDPDDAPLKHYLHCLLS